MHRKNLDHQLHIICDDLLYLSSMVETALADSVTALKDHDFEKMSLVHRNDLQINAKHFEMEGQIIVTIATEAPVLFDLCLLAPSMNICTELEWIGDYAMTAFIRTNVPSAIRIISDDIIDAMYNPLFSGLMNFVIHGMHNTERPNHLLWVAHNLERAADRVTNICERTIYVETGELLDKGSFCVGHPN